MKIGKIKVDQVQKDGTIVEDYDVSLSPTEILAKISEFFPNIRKDDQVIQGVYKGKKYYIRCKNVTYLGNPHAHFKKRIQISGDLFSFYGMAKRDNAEPLLMGIYTYKDNTIFVGFNISTYIEKKAHNSSAHIYSSDLSAASTDGYFEKTDYYNNRITAFTPENASVFLEEMMGITESIESLMDRVGRLKTVDYKIQYSEDKYVFVDTHGLRTYVITELSPWIRTFFTNIKKMWNGIECYTEMIQDNYKNKYQPEWPGFYLEYSFDKFIRQAKILQLIRFEQNKKKGGIDLDLFFSQIGMYGDLKAHSEGSRGIQGNDWDTVFNIISANGQNSHIYYIVCEHATEKDSLHNYEVTKFWNTAQKKPNLMSYSSRMKNNVTLKRMMLLDINSSNCQYLSVFKQGLNSGGTPREPKILIEIDNLKHFIIDELVL